MRAFRVLRVLRVITVIPRMRVVVSALLDAIPGIASVGVVLVLIIYVFAVIAANLYGADHPSHFGTVFTAMYTLFQVMTLEGWNGMFAALFDSSVLRIGCEPGTNDRDPNRYCRARNRPPFWRPCFDVASSFWWRPCA